jgi:hypothetical protein
VVDRDQLSVARSGDLEVLHGARPSPHAGEHLPGPLAPVNPFLSRARGEGRARVVEMSRPTRLLVAEVAPPDAVHIERRCGCSSWPRSLPSRSRSARCRGLVLAPVGE